MACFQKKKASPNIFVLSLSLTCRLSHSPFKPLTIPLAIPKGYGRPATGARKRSARKQRSSQLRRPHQIRPDLAERGFSGSLKPTLAEHGFSVGSQIRLSVGFRPNPVKDLIRPASERGKERKSVDLLKGERERERERGRLCQSS